MDTQNRNRWFLNPGPVLSWIDQFAAELAAQRYSPLTIDGYRASARHFVVWLEGVCISIDDVDDGVLRRFASHQCRCPGGRRWQHVSQKYARREVPCFPATCGRCTTGAEGRVRVSPAGRVSALVACASGIVGTDGRP